MECIGATVNRLNCSNISSPFLNHTLFLKRSKFPIPDYRQPCVATQPIMFYVGLFIYLFLFYFFYSPFSETTRPIHTKFSGIVYYSVV